MTDGEALRRQYQRRFEASRDYRDGVWRAILDGFLQAQIGRDKTVLDMGCGWGEFSRNVSARRRLAMDLNPAASGFLGPGVEFLQQDCCEPWQLQDDSLDVVFSSNFLEHLPDKLSIEAALAEAHRCLRPGGRIILLGPNIRYVGGAYWDYWDHHVPISHLSAVEMLQLKGFTAERVIPRFLPYTMSDGREVPLALVRLYLALPLFWPLLGKQFLIVASSN